MTDAVLPHQLLDNGLAPEPCELLVMGCGNLLRGDDAFGPRLIRLLFEQGVPQGVRLVDGGTAGMDVAFQMQGAARVVIVDASSTGSSPGTIFRVPGQELADLPTVSGLHTHSFRWDHALAFSRWLLGPLCPTDVTVLLVEVEDVTPGADLSATVLAALEPVAGLLRSDFFPTTAAESVVVTADGYLHLDADLAERYFPAGVVGALADAGRVLLVPIRSQANGGHLLKRRNANGDRSLLIREILDADPEPGTCGVHWDMQRGALVVELSS
ncbi:hydrogenase maturation protease [Nocardioides pelophilus]|uniref:hydrogenase maturation protease n=1 Tax=Nocardioides pelophilus TaxID=2172019 RepID=UPI001C7E9506|nr:hydrogenase maturation protease [Nocardioides pelophilus]